MKKNLYIYIYIYIHIYKMDEMNKINNKQNGSLLHQMSKGYR